MQMQHIFWEPSFGGSGAEWARPSWRRGGAAGMFGATQPVVPAPAVSLRGTPACSTEALAAAQSKPVGWPHVEKPVACPHAFPCRVLAFLALLAGNGNGRSGDGLPPDGADLPGLLGLLVKNVASELHWRSGLEELVLRSPCERRGVR